MDEQSLPLKGQVFLLQLMFYLLSSETEPDRGTMTANGLFARYHSIKPLVLRWRDICGG